VETNPRFLAWC